MSFLNPDTLTHTNYDIDAAPSREEDTEALRIALSKFNAATLASMSLAFDQGRSGWNRPSRCHPDYLCFLLKKAINDGDMQSIGNYTVMLLAHGVKDYRPGAMRYQVAQLEAVKSKIQSAVQVIQMILDDKLLTGDILGFYTKMLTDNQNQLKEIDNWVELIKRQESQYQEPSQFE